MKAMDSARGLGASRSDTLWYREELQRRDRVEDALSCFDISGLQYCQPKVEMSPWWCPRGCDAGIALADSVQEILILCVGKPDPGWSVVWSTVKTRARTKVFALHSRRSDPALQAMLGVGWRSE